MPCAHTHTHTSTRGGSTGYHVVFPYLGQACPPANDVDAGMTLECLVFLHFSFRLLFIGWQVREERREGAGEGVREMSVKTMDSVST